MTTFRPLLRALRHAAPVLALLLLAGCLPYGCNRQESRALLPSDSLSRAIAEAVPTDTLRLAWRAGRELLPSLTYPRTLLYGAAGRLYVSDVEDGSILVLGENGHPEGRWAPDGLTAPFLAGMRGDTVVVFDPAERRLDLFAGGALARRVPIGIEPPARSALAYAAATDSAFYFKTVGEEQEGYLVRLDAQGAVAARHALEGPFWRYAGLLRTWGDSLLSLSGYRPVVDVLAPGGAGLDTLALRGFDSPMLARSRLFLRGDVDEAPLLSPAAAAAGDLLFVLNLRPGWVQVDVFDREGGLVRRLVQPSVSYDQRYFPQDLAVRALGEGAYEIAIAVHEPEPQVVVYRWVPGGD